MAREEERQRFLLLTGCRATKSCLSVAASALVVPGHLGWAWPAVSRVILAILTQVSLDLGFGILIYLF